MQDVFKKIIDSLEQKADSIYEDKTVGARFIMLGDARKVVQEVAEEYNNGWIPVEERLPEENINPVTRDYYSYKVTVKFGDVLDVRDYKFGNGHWHCGFQIMDDYVVAWQPLPEKYQPKGD